MKTNKKQQKPDLTIQKNDAPLTGGNSQAELQLLIKKSQELIEKNPKKAASVITRWLNSSSKSSKKVA